MHAVETEIPRGTLIDRGYAVDSLAGAIRDGEHGLKLVPGLLKRVCNEQCWQARYVESTGEHVEFDTFPAFVSATPPNGLGVDLETLRKLCRDDVEAMDIIDRETRRPAHIHARHDVDNINVTERPTGTSADYALRKLREDAPELHRQVLDGALSPHAAMVEAGFRRKTITVPVDPERAAATLARHFTHDELREIVQSLSEMIQGRC